MPFLQKQAPPWILGGYWGNALISILTTVLKAKRAPVTRQVSYTFIYITEHISYWEMHTEGHKALAVVP